MILGAGLVCLESTRADINLPSVPPPQPTAVNLQIHPGESVEIPLKGISRSGLQLRFVMRSDPVLGKISEVETTGPSTAKVIYTHDPKAGAGVDQFRYAVQAPNTGVSTPAVITVRIVERASNFIAPNRIEFSSIPVGETETKVIQIRNDGGGVVAGTLDIPEPWSIPYGDGSYRVGSGESAEIAIQFSPTDAHQYAAAAGFSHEPGLKLGLGGHAFWPVEAVPQKIVLARSGSGFERSGEFTLRNRTETDRELKIESPGELIVPATVTVPANSEIPVAVRTREGVLGGFESVLELSGESISLEIPVQVYAAPPSLELVSRATADFGRILEGRTGRVSVTIKNSGGSEASVQAAMPAGMGIEPEPSLSPIPPGESRTYELSIAAGDPRQIKDRVVFAAEGSQLAIPVTAIVERDSQRAASQAGSAGSGKAAARPRVEINDIPPVESVGVARRTKSEIDLVWDKTAPNIASYILLQRKIKFAKDGTAVLEWKSMNAAKVRMTEKYARTTLAGLRAGEQVSFCIFAVDARGVRSRPSDTFTVSTEHARPIRIPWTILGIVILAVCVFVIIRERRRRRESMHEELDQIAKM